MRTTAKERCEVHDQLARIGISFNHAITLRHIAMTLHNWYEKECGTDDGCIEHDETTNKPYWLNSTNRQRYLIADREKGALCRLLAVMTYYPKLVHYVQTDPRGASLYILTQEQAHGSPLDNIYNRGVAVY